MPPVDGVIHDIGYQRYSGPRLGRGYALRSLYVHGVRTAYGFGRSAKAKIFPWAIAGIMVLVATIDVAIRARSGIMPITYLDYPANLAVPVLFFVAATAPELVSRDLRNKVLPLYFSRPLRRSDYAWAKLAALITAIFALIAVPMGLIYVCGLFTVSGWPAMRHETWNFLGGLGLAGIYAIVFGALGLVIASLFGRRMVAAAVIVGYVLVTSAIGGAVGEIIGDTRGKATGQLFGPPTLLLGLREWIYRFHGSDIGTMGPAFLAVALGLVLACVGLLHLRYRKVSA